MNYTIAENKYGKYALPEGVEHRPAAQLALQGDVYEPDTIQYMIDNCGDGAIVHAGAFFGDFIPALASTGNHVLCFEPVTDNFDAAVETIRLNLPEDHDVLLVHGALGAEPEMAQIMWKDHLGQKLGGASRFGFSIHNSTEDQLQHVQIFTLDRIAQNIDHVSIIQLDVEGHEEEALKGGLETIKRCKPHLILERWFPEMLESEFYQTEIFPLGYKEVGMVHDNVVLRVE